MRFDLKAEYSDLFRLGLPVLVTQLGVIVVNFADTMMVGHYGTPELSSAAFVNSLFLIPLVMQLGFANGLTPLVGALFSRGSFMKAGRLMKAGLISNVILSLIFMAIMGILYFFLPYFGQDEDLLPIIRPYYLIALVSLLPGAVFCACQQVANGSTDTAMPMWVMISGNVFNIFGNWMLIWGIGPFPELGLVGAGISTLTARSLMAVAILLLFLLRKRYSNYIKGMRLRLRGRGIMREVALTSYPVMIQSGVECMLWSVGAIVCGGFGKLQIAGFQVTNTIGQLGFMIYISFSTAVAIRVANYTGLNDIRGVRRTTTAGLHMLMMLGTLSSLVFILFARPLIWAFTDDQDVTAMALSLIPPLVVYQYGDAIQLVFANALRGMADVKPLLSTSLISYLLIGIPVMYLMSTLLGMEAQGVYYSFSFALFAASALYYRAYRKHFRSGLPKIF